MSHLNARPGSHMRLDMHEQIVAGLDLSISVQRDVIDSLVALIRDLMMDTDTAPAYYPDGPCVWCASYSDEEPHQDDCAWLRAKAIVDKGEPVSDTSQTYVKPSPMIRYLSHPGSIGLRREAADGNWEVEVRFVRLVKVGQ